MTLEKESQLATAVLMIRPARFQSNPETAASNRFQGRTEDSPAAQHAAAIREFDGFREALENAGIRVVVFDDTPEPHTPDAIFPNNWVSFHADGTVVLYSMEARNRRSERRRDIIESLAADHGFLVRDIVDLSYHENDGRYLEGTGSMVLDRVHRLAYACLSSRTHLDVLADFGQRLDYEIVAFDAADRDGKAIYHTNVLMNIGEEIAVLCDEAITRPDQRAAVMESLRSNGREVVTLTFAQLQSFAGNLLELKSSSGHRAGHRVMVMSERARGSLSNEQLERLLANGEILSAPIDTIEKSAGGSVRCMLAEIHLPPA